MTTARNFYLTFMRLAKRINKSKTQRQLSKNIDDYVQPLADVFDDDGLDIVDDYQLANGNMVLDYGSEYPLLKSKCDTLHRGWTYIAHFIKRPVKSYVGKTLISTSTKTYEYLTYPTKSLVEDYMCALLDKALTNTANRYNSDRQGGFWIDRSAITPLEEYHMRNVIGIKTSKGFISHAKYERKQQKDIYKQNLIHTIKKNKAVIKQYQNKLNQI